MALQPARRAALAAGLNSFLSAAAKGKPPGVTILYSSQPNWPYGSAQKGKNESGPLEIGVLDSSFNPPTLAHRAIALGPALLATDSTSSSREYDAHLLLFSVRNADKGTGRKGDATQLQRLEMMELLARDMEAELRTRNGSHGPSGQDEYEPAVAVAIVEPPLMIEKSTLLHEYIADSQRSQPGPAVRFHWQAGVDTLERFFALRYYPSEEAFHAAAHHFFEQERTTFVAASRGAESLPGKSLESESEDALLQSALVRPWVERRSVAMWQIPDEVQACSSTDVRTICKQHAGSELQQALKGKVIGGIAQYLAEEQVYGTAGAEAEPQ